MGSLASSVIFSRSSLLRIVWQRATSHEPLGIPLPKPRERFLRLMRQHRTDWPSCWVARGEVRKGTPERGVFARRVL